MKSEKTLESMAELTKHYAAYGGERGGLVAVFGGALLVGISALGTWWSVDYVSLTPSAWRAFLTNPDNRGDIVFPFWLTLAAWVTPFLFLAVSAWLRCRLYMGFGRVKALEPAPKSPAPRAFIFWSGFAAVVLTLLLGMAFGVFEGHNHFALRMLGECCLGAAFVGTVRLRKPRGDELGLLLFLWLGAALASMGTLWLWIPISWLMALFSLVLAVRGLFQHRVFLKLRRELEALEGPEATDV